MTSPTGARASLFVTCLVDQLYPSVGMATVKLLRRLGVHVDFPRSQTCCGQPLFNSGHVAQARHLARQALEVFAADAYVVVPSGSCASMVKVFYPHLFRDDPALHARAQDLAARTYELSEFIVKVLGRHHVDARYQARIAYHPSCHQLRELGVQEEPLALLRCVKDAQLVELPPEVASQCCGFGGTFSVKFPHISVAMAEDKLRAFAAAPIDTVVSCDMGCLMHLAGVADRRRIPLHTMHLAELLAQEG